MIQNTKMDSCFHDDLINKIQCTIIRQFSIENPPYETTYEHRDNYSINYP